VPYKVRITEFASAVPTKFISAEDDEEIQHFDDNVYTEIFQPLKFMYPVKHYLQERLDKWMSQGFLCGYPRVRVQVQ